MIFDIYEPNLANRASNFRYDFMAAKRHNQSEWSSKNEREKAREPLSFLYCAQQDKKKSSSFTMAVIQETNDDIPQQPHREVVVNTNIAESEAEESDVDEEHEENNEEGNVVVDSRRQCVYIHAFCIA